MTPLRSVLFQFQGVALGSLGFDPMEKSWIEDYLMGYGTGTNYPRLYAVKARRLIDALNEATIPKFPKPTPELLGLEPETQVFFGNDSL